MAIVVISCLSVFVREGGRSDNHRRWDLAQQCNKFPRAQTGRVSPPKIIFARGMMQSEQNWGSEDRPGFAIFGRNLGLGPMEAGKAKLHGKVQAIDLVDAIVAAACFRE